MLSTYDDAVVARSATFDGGEAHLPVRALLLERLGEATGAHRLTVLCAPSGYGKTATVTAWLGDGSDPRRQVRWVRGARCAADAIWHSIAEELAPFSRNPAAPGDDPVRAAMRAAAAITSPVTLVLDDYHHATSPENDTAIAELAAASGQLRLVVAGRRITLLDSHLVRAKVRVLRIGPGELLLGPDEARRFAASRGVPRSNRLDAALEQADGWPLAIAAALDLGSDELSLGAQQGRARPGSAASRDVDPVANLTSFALASLEVLAPPARHVLLAAAQLDAIGVTQLGRLLEAGPDAALGTARQLVEAGLLVRPSGSHTAEFRCHRSVRAALHEIAARAMDAAERARLYRDRAAELEYTDPFSAFRLYCAAGRYDAAELVLGRDFAVITAEPDARAQLLRAVPEEALLAHPTITFALIFLELPQVDVSVERILHLVRIWARGLEDQLPQGIATPPGPLHFPLLCQAMAVARLLEGPEASLAILRHIEGLLTPSQVDDDPTAAPEHAPVAGAPVFSGFLPAYFHFAATTAIMAGDLDCARRNLNRLRRRSERMIAGSAGGAAVGSAGSTLDAGHCWLLVAFGGLAFTELLEGDMRSCAAALAEMDAIVERAGAVAPSISWAGAEVARAHLSYELDDHAQLRRANARLEPLGPHLEYWPLLVVAQAAWIRQVRGTCAALAHLRAGVAEIPDVPRSTRGWSEYLLGYEIMLCTSLGDLPTAAALVASAPNDSPRMRLERARIALFSCDDVEALLTAQQVALPGTTTRQRLDRLLISAVAAWNCGRRDDAFLMLREAAELLERHQLPSSLQNVPYRALRGLAVAAREAGVCDLVGLVDEVPESARAKRYERLTEMELRTLRTIARHRSANNAATELFVTPGTVKKHLASVYRKLGVSGRDEAILQAGRMGILG
ncbi:MAG: LuxR C-terminal-related transcriptional regulator [Micropruina sp.]|uniref:LuxR C-terminal-related transcriptional regulator n=1 Tax=Micropruina sp. TaxID=2737536 RepID=UPI0039E62036